MSDNPENETSNLFDLEPLIGDAANMVDVLFSMIEEHFSRLAEPDGYKLSSVEGSRLFFIACVAARMTEQARDGYYTAFEAWQTEREARR